MTASMPGTRGDFLAVADSATALLRRPELAAAWERPSALPGLGVGGLAYHLGFQLTGQTQRALDNPTTEHEATSLVEHFLASAWVGADIDSEANVGIRTRSEHAAAGGIEALRSDVEGALAELRKRLAAEPADRVVWMPWVGRALLLDDFLVTRMLELAVHSDDLAVSLGIDPPELPPTAVDTLVELLARLAVRRHGQSATLRALTRAERAPRTIAAI